MIVGAEWSMCLMLNLGGTAGIPSRPIVDGSFVLSYRHQTVDLSFF